MTRVKLLRRSTICFVIVLVATFVIYLCVLKEPRYQGRKLSDWIDIGRKYDHSTIEWHEASLAVQQIGPDAIPFLLKWAAESDSKASVGYWVDPYLPPHFGIRSAADRRSEAYFGFRMLGDKARPVWPVLIQWTNYKDVERRRSGVEALVYSQVDKNTILPVLRRMLNDPDRELRREAAVDLCYYDRKEAEAAGVFKQFPELAVPQPLPPPRFNSNVLITNLTLENK